MSDMTTDEMMLVMINLDPYTKLGMVEPKFWVVEMPSLGDQLVDNGNTPESAIENAWNQLSDGRTLVLNAGKRSEAHYHWAGKFFARDAVPPKPRKPTPDAPAPEAAPKADLLPMDTAETPPKRKGAGG